jgi:epoxyqueuosine reductase QueG
LDWAEAKVKYLLRDVVVALGNSRDKTAFLRVKKLLENPDETIRKHASWAAKKLGMAI